MVTKEKIVILERVADVDPGKDESATMNFLRNIGNLVWMYQLATVLVTVTLGDQTVMDECDVSSKFGMGLLQGWFLTPPFEKVTCVIKVLA